MANIKLPGMPQTPGIAQPVLQQGKQIRIDPSSAFAAQRSAGMQPLMPAEMFESGAAGEAWGKTLMELGKTGVSIAGDFQKMRDDKALADVDVRLNDSTSEFINGLAKNHNPETWLPLYQEHVEKIRPQILDSIPMSRTARQSAEIRFGLVASKARANIASTAVQQGVYQAKQTYALRESKLIDAGDFEGARASISESKGNGARSPIDADSDEWKVTQMERQSKLNNLIATDPKGTAELLKQPSKWQEFGLNAATALEAQGKAASAAAFKEARSMEFYKTMILQGGKPEEVLSIVSQDLTPLTLETLKQNIKQQRLQNDPVQFESWHKNIAAYNAKDDPTGIRRAEIETQIALNFDGPKEAELKDQLTKQADRSEPADATDLSFTQSLGEVEDTLKSGGFGVFQWVYDGKNVKWDDAAKSWVRLKSEWEEGPDSRPIKVDPVTSQKLTQGLLKPGDVIEDVSAKDVAGRKAAMYRTLLEKRWKEGEYKTPTAMTDDFRSMMSAPSEESAKSKLPTRSPVDAPAQALSPLLPSVNPPDSAQLYDLMKKYGSPRN